MNSNSFPILKSSGRDFCGFCGAKFSEESKAVKTYKAGRSYEIKCDSCGEISWDGNKNAVMVFVPVFDGKEFCGVIMTERSIAPIGGFCMPGGFQDRQEHYFDTAAREFQEEVLGEDKPIIENFFLNPKNMRLVDVVLGTKGATNLFRIVHAGTSYDRILPFINEFTPNSEVSKVWIQPDEDIDLCFPAQNEFFQQEMKKMSRRKNSFTAF